MSDPDGPYQSYIHDGCEALFLRRCPNCGRIVKADETVRVNGFEELIEEPNATCSKCGRIEMPFLGWF